MKIRVKATTIEPQERPGQYTCTTCGLYFESGYLCFYGYVESEKDEHGELQEPEESTLILCHQCAAGGIEERATRRAKKLLEFALAEVEHCWPDEAF